MTLPRLHVVTDDGVLERADLRAAASAILEAGGARVALHVRGPRTSGRRVFETVEALKPEAAAAGARLFVNDRVDVALATGVPNVHLGGRSLPLSDARRLLGPRAVLGRSCHDPGEVGAAAREGADFVFVGTIFPTPSHPGVEGLGTDALRSVSAGALPWVGIGGIDPSRVAEVLRAGAHGVAVVRGVWDARDPACAVESYLAELAAVVEQRSPE